MLSDNACSNFGRVVFRYRTEAPTIVTTVRDHDRLHGHERFCGHADTALLVIQCF